jgi:hypothetical protein
MGARHGRCCGVNAKGRFNRGGTSGRVGTLWTPFRPNERKIKRSRAWPPQQPFACLLPLYACLLACSSCVCGLLLAGMIGFTWCCLGFYFKPFPAGLSCDSDFSFFLFSSFGRALLRSCLHTPNIKNTTTAPGTPFLSPLQTSTHAHPPLDFTSPQGPPLQKVTHSNLFACTVITLSVTTAAASPLPSPFPHFSQHSTSRQTRTGAHAMHTCVWRLYVYRIAVTAPASAPQP